MFKGQFKVCGDIRAKRSLIPGIVNASLTRGMGVFITWWVLENGLHAQGILYNRAKIKIMVKLKRGIY